MRGAVAANRSEPVPVLKPHAEPLLENRESFSFSCTLFDSALNDLCNRLSVDVFERETTSHTHTDTHKWTNNQYKRIRFQSIWRPATDSIFKLHHSRFSSLFFPLIPRYNPGNQCAQLVLKVDFCVGKRVHKVCTFCNRLEFNGSNQHWHHFPPLVNSIDGNFSPPVFPWLLKARRFQLFLNGSCVLDRKYGDVRDDVMASWCLVLSLNRRAIDKKVITWFKLSLSLSLCSVCAFIYCKWRG